MTSHTHCSQGLTGKSAYGVKDATPFDSAEEAWFWFINAQDAKNDGAKYVAGAGLYKRPCEPVEILNVLDRLYRKRRLQRDHLLVLRHYGRRHIAPDRYRAQEVRAYHLWKEAMGRIEDVLIAKGIVARRSHFEMPAFMVDEAFMNRSAGMK